MKKTFFLSCIVTLFLVVIISGCKGSDTTLPEIQIKDPYRLMKLDKWRWKDGQHLQLTVNLSLVQGSVGEVRYTFYRDQQKLLSGMIPGNVFESEGEVHTRHIPLPLSWNADGSVEYDTRVSGTTRVVVTVSPDLSETGQAGGESSSYWEEDQFNKMYGEFQGPADNLDVPESSREN